MENNETIIVDEVVDKEVTEAETEVETEEEVEVEEKQNFFKKAWGSVKNAWTTFKTWILGVFAKIKESKFGATIKGGFTKFIGWIKNLGAKIFGTKNANDMSKEGLGVLKDTAVVGTAAKQSDRFAKRLWDKVTGFFSRHKVLGTIAKVLGIGFGVMFGAGVLYYAIQLFPVVLAATAEVLAVALIVRGVFAVIENITGGSEAAED